MFNQLYFSYYKQPPIKKVINTDLEQNSQIQTKDRISTTIINTKTIGHPITNNRRFNMIDRIQNGEKCLACNK